MAKRFGGTASCNRRPVKATSPPPRYELNGQLARLSLPKAGGDAGVRLARVNSICLLFLVIGLAGARRGEVSIKPVPPLRVEVPVVVQPAVLPPQAVAPTPAPVAPTAPTPVRVILPTAPTINFGVPTAGALVAEVALATAPALAAAPVSVRAISVLSNTGPDGERPAPPYPKLALAAGQQGAVILSLTGDDAGNLVAVEVKTSSGFPLLDRATVDFIKRHWRLPTDGATRRFETRIAYKLLLN